jgi:UDP-glucose 6-dehydrogenase
MNLPKEFNYYLERKIVRRVSPDKPRAEFLLRESNLSFEGLNERVEIIGINDKNANSIVKDCYDILMERIRSKMLFLGYSSTGSYSHEAEVSYFMELGFLESEVSFLNELRYFRNSVTYYGKILDKEYAEKVFSFLKKVRLKIK